MRSTCDGVRFLQAPHNACGNKNNIFVWEKVNKMKQYKQVSIDIILFDLTDGVLTGLASGEIDFGELWSDNNEETNEVLTQ